MKTLIYNTSLKFKDNFGGQSFDKRSRAFKVIANNKYNTPHLIQVANEYGLPVEVISLRIKDINLFHNFDNQLN